MARVAEVRYLLFLPLLILAQGLNAMGAVGESPRLVAPAEVDGWKLAAAEGQPVTAQTIFEYMDGAGEMYLAYQFRGLCVWTYTRDGGTTITVEAYDMGAPGEAFGVLSQDLDGEDVKIGRQSVYAAGLLRLWQGQWFFRILAEFETPDSRRAVLDLGRAFAAQVPSEGKRPDLLTRLPAEGLTSHSVHYFHTQISLNALYFFAVENLLQLDRQTEAVMGEYRFDKQPANLLIVRYPSVAAARKARSSFADRYLAKLAISPEPFQMAQLENGEWVGLRLDREHLIVAFRSRSRDVCERLLKAVNFTKRGKES